MSNIPYGVNTNIFIKLGVCGDGSARVCMTGNTVNGLTVYLLIFAVKTAVILKTLAGND